jgi:hypothetical protein
MSAIVEGTTVEIGDYVGFKSDIEQSGRIYGFKKGPYGGGKILQLEADSDNGFNGEYIGGDQTTEQFAMDCWVD